MLSRLIDLHASRCGVAWFHKAASAWCTEAITIEPSPTAEATRLIDPARTSPTATRLRTFFRRSLPVQCVDLWFRSLSGLYLHTKSGFVGCCGGLRTHREDLFGGDRGADCVVHAARFAPDRAPGLSP